VFRSIAFRCADAGLCPTLIKIGRSHCIYPKKPIIMAPKAYLAGSNLFNCS
jgi:hypothetical protein